MRYLLILFALLLGAGCELQSSSSSRYLEVSGDNYQIVTIDSCEYIKSNDETYSRYLTHKGNCNNPEHKRK